ncbi:Cobalt-precorrin-4 C(11)-methyltransferase [uncultured delta proteobacterium]|uniref:Cobalt-precorrin-4 C(11)-methyltransferase n=1 Tax=uncultured delta proteobacterium TaxID=34034 RepID=A0A212JDW2_9DELT|nr:Cobalt-precorrin-4 C(11)-methyltransferase [uncultured delta proteobacterium]
MQGTVFFIGAGPGDPELITVKGRRLIDAADLVLYAGSLVPQAVVARTKPGAAVVDSSGMTLEETHALMRETARAGKTVARVHTGDPSLYGAVREQMALLDADAIPYEIVPGVTAAFAAAAAGRVSLTVPESVQSFSVTRLGGRTDVPPGQSVRDLARHGGSLAVYLSAPDASRLEKELLAGGVDPQTPVLIAYRVGWPEERLVRTDVSSLTATVAAEKFTRQTVFLVLPGERDNGREKGGSLVSRLYAGDFFHGFRKSKEGEDA